MGDGNGRMWVANSSYDAEASLLGFDVDTLELVRSFEAFWSDHPSPMRVGKGVSVDYDGYVWQVGKDLGAYRFDPETGDYEVYDGLVPALHVQRHDGLGPAQRRRPERRADDTRACADHGQIMPGATHTSPQQSANGLHW
jgi:hypothetical protein